MKPIKTIILIKNRQIFFTMNFAPHISLNIPYMCLYYTYIYHSDNGNDGYSI